jgi:hypothetical protein
LALDELTAENRAARSSAVERELVALRHRAVDAVPRSAPDHWPPEVVDPFPDVDGVPEIDATRVDVERLAGGIVHHGCLALRGLFDAATVDRVVAGIDAAIEEWDHRDEAGPPDDPWLVAFDPGPGRDVGGLRKWVADRKGIWLADAPRLTFEILDIVGRTGVLRAIAEHFGERPAFSLEKSTLRRTPPQDRIATWHQDGAFLDPGVRTVNLWIALTTCGGDATVPGLDVFPKRFPELVVEPAAPAAAHSVGFETIDRLAEETPPIRPPFEAGDALLFDELFLHRTGISPGMDRDRYALECWFFAPSRAPASYTCFVA